MIISDKEALNRLNNPMNLINQIKDKSSSRSSAMGLFGLGKGNVKKEEVKEIKISFNPFEEKNLTVIPFITKPITEQITPDVRPEKDQSENLDSILDNSEQQIKLSLAHDSALGVLTDAVSMLKLKLDDIDPERLPSVITATSKVVESIRRERNEASKSGKDKSVHYHFYTPVQKKISDYEVIEIS